MDLQDVGGYVLAGGKSSRMGRDKALLELGGRPLALCAVARLRRICGDVRILSSRQELAAFAPLVPDLHEGCGPLGGIEAALEHTSRAWSLFLPVDMPFLPTALLEGWVRTVVTRTKRGTRVAMFSVEGRLQPALCMLHQEVRPFVRRAVAAREFKLLSVLEMAAKELAREQDALLEDVLFDLAWKDGESSFNGLAGAEGGAAWVPAETRPAIREQWFANLNTPAEFAVAESFAATVERDEATLAALSVKAHRMEKSEST